ncbi:potassium-transporting ATPase subunit C [Anaerocolumna xylanovorans]|uniref:Potassium-transporting ATPase KdpC subunit n=1 Tax=Anaerocolumna xylanovorans DSM 12503 TaxID=1121345 RepID=A0A1M7YFS7_9FIRM|nr:potassium-transporting ATPase subunit C [Anaerocolumna xylanovorans]SHO51494.1 K+-transporting ATPase ATPase C chain [Anaerocolumna xylanovorans DSM 12503]
MKSSRGVLRPAIVCLLLMTALCGVLYTAAVTGIAGIFFPQKANGSIITVTLKDGSRKEYGSALIAQEFSDPKYLIGRPLGTSNLSPTSAEQKKLVEKRIEWWHNLDPDNKREIPSDLVTASASGVDPGISPDAAAYQAGRIARERGMTEDEVKEIIDKYTIRSFLGIFGEPAVNVLKVNLALDGLL